jgi:two-component system, OmpR family, sensor kinase
VWHSHHTHLRHLHGQGYPPRRRRLQHLFFIWLALSIVATAATVWMLFWLTFPGELPSVRRMRQLSELMEKQFADRWSDAAARHTFAEDVSRAVGVTLWLESDTGAPIERVGPECSPVAHTLDIHQNGALLGRVSACLGHEDHPGPLTPIVMLLGAVSVLWCMAALVAHKIGRPLSLLIAVTREIGAGNLTARVRLGRYQKGELGLLAESVNDMASRIERQISDQRELLAAVSHEVRSPLARLRVSTELLRSDPHNVPALDALEREVVELDTLVGKLLVNSRLDFEALAKSEVVGAELFAEVLARRKLPPTLLEDGSEAAQVQLDPTLISRALENLLDNAARHGNGPTRCAVRRAEPRETTRASDALVFEVCDGGPGFDVKTLPRVFDAFYRASATSPADTGSLGLGLALVRRIAQAHGGRAWAENLAAGGARVAFSVSLAGARPAE